MIKILFFTFPLFLFAALWFSCTLPVSAQTEGQIQYDNHPCGFPTLSLDSIRMYFFHEWQARSAELHDLAREEWIRYHNVRDLGITKVLAFQSPMQRTIAVVSAKAIDNVMCIVKVKDELALAYTSEKLQEILSGNYGDEINLN
jgi:hypothetical protein